MPQLNDPVYLPASLKSIKADSFSSPVGYIVAEGNPNFVSVDGVLYTKDMSELVSFPARKVMQEYRVPDTVTYIREGALHKVQYVDKLFIPNTVQKMCIRDRNCIIWSRKTTTLRSNATSAEKNIISAPAPCWIPCKKKKQSLDGAAAPLPT